MDDRKIVAAQIERPPRSPVVVTTRCPLGLPVVTTVPPILDDGTPFPTLYWLTCPLALRRVGRIEATGGVRHAEQMIGEDADLGARHDAAAERYRAERESMIPAGYTGPRPTGGVGGSGAGIKCLHSHYADTVAGNDNPVGAWVAAQVEPLDCRIPCVVTDEDGSVRRNPDWVEPR